MMAVIEIYNTPAFKSGQKGNMLFKGALKLYLLNRGKGEEAEDVSPFFQVIVTS
jgi:hypothetical protein